MEEFRKIEGFDNYSVSNFGNVRNDITGKILKPGISKTGYYVVTLSKNGKCSTKKVHRLIGSNFIENLDNKDCIDHIDNNRLNNHLDNLRWCTVEENNRNISLSKINTSGHKGVYFDNFSKKWKAQIRINSKNTHIGRYNTKEEAALARLRVAQEIFGEYINGCELDILNK